MQTQGLDFGRKRHSVGQCQVVERLFAGAVARQKQRLALHVPNGERKHSVQACETIHAPALERFEDHLRIGLGGEHGALALQLVAQLAKVIELAVVDNPASARYIRHRLVRALVQVDHGQPPVGEDDGRQDDDLFGVGAAVA